MALHYQKFRNRTVQQDWGLFQHLTCIGAHEKYEGDKNKQYFFCHAFCDTMHEELEKEGTPLSPQLTLSFA